MRESNGDIYPSARVWVSKNPTGKMERRERRRVHFRSGGHEARVREHHAGGTNLRAKNIHSQRERERERERGRVWRVVGGGETRGGRQTVKSFGAGESENFFPVLSLAGKERIYRSGVEKKLPAEKSRVIHVQVYIYSEVGERERERDVCK